MSDIGDKVHRLRIAKHMTLEQLADAVGVTKSTVRKWEEGLIKNMKRNNVAKLAEALGTTPAFLLDWPQEKKIVNLSRTIPVYSSLCCGDGLMVEEYAEEMITMPSPMLNASSSYFANPADGDSMEPIIRNGDYLVFESSPVVTSGKIGAFLLNGKYFCKRYKEYPDGSKWLLSENSSYEPIKITPDDDFRTLGLYKIKISKEQ